MNYGIIKDALLAIVDWVRHIRGWLHWHSVTSLTDHQLLVACISSLQTNQIMLRWQESLSQLDITMEHIDHKTNVIADALSRTYTASPSASSKQSLLYTDHYNSTSVLPTITTHHLPLNLATSTTLPCTSIMRFQNRTRRAMSNITGRYEDSHEYDPEDWELKINTE